MKLLTDIDGFWINWILSFADWVSENKGYEPIKPRHVNQTYEIWGGNHYGEDVTEEMIWEWIAEYNVSEESDGAYEYDGATYTLCQIALLMPIIAITANDPRRKLMLGARFPGVFEDVLITGLHCNKHQVLLQYPESIWAEDNFKNALSGLEAGHIVVLLTRPYNAKFGEKDGVVPLKDWCDRNTICRVENYDELLKFINQIVNPQ